MTLHPDPTGHVGEPVPLSTQNRLLKKGWPEAHNVGDGDYALHELYYHQTNNEEIGDFGDCGPPLPLTPNYGMRNVAIGFETAYSAVALDDCVILGTKACRGPDGGCGGKHIGNVLIGTETGYFINDGSNYNVMIGDKSGHGDGCYDGSLNNIIIGKDAGYNIIGGWLNNIIIGFEAGKSVTSAITNNIFIGNGAGKSSTGNDNIIIGYQSGISSTGNKNVVIGYNLPSITKDNCVIVGNSASDPSGNNMTLIGYGVSSVDGAADNATVMYSSTKNHIYADVENRIIAPTITLNGIVSITTTGSTSIVDLAAKIDEIGGTSGNIAEDLDALELVVWGTTGSGGHTGTLFSHTNTLGNFGGRIITLEGYFATGGIIPSHSQTLTNYGITIGNHETRIGTLEGLFGGVVASGTFTGGDGSTITVTNGLITGIAAAPPPPTP